MVKPESTNPLITCCILYIFKDFIYLFFREREREGEREGETLILPRTPQPGDLAHNPGGACAQAGNPTGDLSVCRPVPSPLSHRAQR